jgi:hypothetical protein
MKCVFVRYNSVPAPCHGDDDPETLQVFNLWLRNDRQIHTVKVALENRYGGYVQLWDSDA